MNRWPGIVMWVTAVVLIGGAIAWFALGNSKPIDDPPIPPGPQTTTTILRFHGSNTLGGKLVPALAAAFLEQDGYVNVRKYPGAHAEESSVEGDRGNERARIEIFAHGSSTAFKDLKAGACDIGMASRPIKAEERYGLEMNTNLPALADQKPYSGEYVLALDGIAIIAHPINGIQSLSIAQLADVFGGTLTDWSQLGGPSAPITIYARDVKSGTREFFNDAVLKRYGKTLAASSDHEFEDSQELSNRVAGDPGGIGFVGLNYVGSSKVIGLFDNGVQVRKPSLMTIKTRDYLLSRQLYLYTAVAPTNKYIARFIEFALGSKGKAVVTDAGLVNTDITPLSVARDSNDARNASAEWQLLTEHAIPIPTYVNFHSGSSYFESLANQQLREIVNMVSQQYQNRRLILIGFADSTGSSQASLNISRDRVAKVKQELAAQGLPIAAAIGLGATAFIRSNDTEEGRMMNRRVEVWIR